MQSDPQHWLNTGSGKPLPFNGLTVHLRAHRVYALRARTRCPLLSDKSVPPSVLWVGLHSPPLLSRTLRWELRLRTLSLFLCKDLKKGTSVSSSFYYAFSFNKSNIFNSPFSASYGYEMPVVNQRKGQTSPLEMSMDIHSPGHPSLSHLRLPFVTVIPFALLCYWRFCRCSANAAAVIVVSSLLRSAISQYFLKWSNNGTSSED
ncbi:hypothetical protein BVRB_6g142030 [Beta vulgaris subsp. vulgaris]|nr:hypothetical protein BVRB_6g142030 [Beta vulgaris subsp. vulgaris]